MGLVSETRQAAYRVVLLAAAVVALGLLFEQIVTLLLAVLVTIIIAIPLAACADWLETRGVPRPFGVLAGMLAGLAVVAAVLSLVIPPFADQAERLVDEVPGIVDELQGHIHDLTGASDEDIGREVQDFLEGLLDDPQPLLGRITSIGLSIAAVLGALVLVLITAFFMASQPGPLIDGLLRLFPPPRRPHVRHVLGRLRTSWIGWMRGVVVDMFVTGSLLYLGLTLVDLDFAIVFAVLTALLVVVPYFGAVIGGTLPVLFALTDSPGKALLVLAVYVAVQQIESNIIIPVVMSRTVRLHPALIAIGVVLVGQVFGFIGLFVAVPILSAIVILVDELWVKPVEERHGADQEAALAMSGEGPPPGVGEPGAEEEPARPLR